jgi:hypothetical protein
MPNPRGINQYSKGRGKAAGSGGHAKPAWGPPNPTTRMRAPKGAQRDVRKAINAKGSNAAKAKNISAALQRSGVTVQNQASHQRFIQAQLAKRAAKRRR